MVALPPATLTEVHHRENLVEDPQLALGGAPVTQVGKDAAVEEGAVPVGHHRPNVAQRGRGEERISWRKICFFASLSFFSIRGLRLG